MENDIEIKEEKPRFSLDKKKICKIASIVLPLLLILLSFAVVVYYILGPAEGYFHSDCTDTLLWAQASYDSGKLISDNFKYAALLPFGGNLLMLPFIPIFGVSMTTHNIGMVLRGKIFVEDRRQGGALDYQGKFLHTCGIEAVDIRPKFGIYTLGVYEDAMEVKEYGF